MSPDTKPDGRQSPKALMIQRGVGRLLRNTRFAILPEFTLATGRRVDVIGINEAGEIWIIEIKSSADDFRSDLKWQDYQGFCDKFYFAISEDLDPRIMPLDTGLIIADRWGAEILRDATTLNLHAARRRALTLAFARAAALRLHGLYDPEPEPLR